MKKLKLQVQISIDGYISPYNSQDWLVWAWGKEWTWDEALQNYFIHLTSSISCVLLSRKMAEEGFIDHWAAIGQDAANPQSTFARIIAASDKVVFSRTLKASTWPNTTLARNELVNEVMTLKKTSHKDLIVYGGSSFVSSLISAELIDEYYLFVNPVALGNGLKIFNERTNLKLMEAQAFSCGVTVLKYVPASKI
ncbi:dihydrofolate reductase family protein [Fulvivirgaceae bacterium PWU4]|uniref:Dihydrofolate reductase family protein n=1 Tax=Chryseosolibacter histidini TaxID=2782349 RepID=A0AAP2GL75_9BACT|nr:dihydrofolate reductase family protein [Chryseosolibacter histidini]MBT1695543.1 dihydrofolate reductase family protein [Chryseosolibacter histidini]